MHAPREEPPARAAINITSHNRSIPRYEGRASGRSALAQKIRGTVKAQPYDPADFESDRRNAAQ